MFQFWVTRDATSLNKQLVSGTTNTNAFNKIVLLFLFSKIILHNFTNQNLSICHPTFLPAVLDLHVQVPLCRCGSYLMNLHFQVCWRCRSLAWERADLKKNNLLYSKLVKFSCLPLKKQKNKCDNLQLLTSIELGTLFGYNTTRSYMLNAISRIM